MMKKTLAIIALLVLISGCSQPEQSETTPAGGTLTFDVEIEDNIIEQGDSTTITLSLLNMFSNDIENIEVTLEPLTTGITYTVSGPDSVESEKTEEWDIEVNTSPGLTAKSYNLYPSVCFDYTQQEIVYFRVANGNPSESADSSLSETGPIDITLGGIKSIDINGDTSLDITVEFSFNNKISGGSSIYTDESELVFTAGEFRLDTVDNTLALYTTEGGASNNLNKGADNYCIVQTGGDNRGHAVCYFTPAAAYDASDKLDFDIILPEELTGEIESSFTATVTYTYCFRSTSTVTRITVEENN